MGDYLPPVIAELRADISDLAAKVAQAKALINSLNGDVNVDIKFNVDPASYAAAKAAIKSLGIDPLKVPVGFYVNMASWAMTYTQVQALLLTLHADTININFQFNWASYAATLAQFNTLNSVINTINRTTNTAARGGLVNFRNGIALTGQAIHWIIAISAEFLAVFIPAIVALGAAMAVAAQGAQNVYIHMSSLYTATEATANMFHTTMGQALHLGSALQQAQNAANPVVYSILGGAVMALHGQFSSLANVGLEVMRVFQNFSAHMVQDFQTGMGGQVTAILHNMIADLVTFGQILGNLSHALLNFAAAMPGLAEILLSIVNSISQFILWVSKVPPVLITVVMAMEEFWRWGGALAGLLTRLPMLFTGLLASVFGLVPVFARLAEIVRAVLLLFPLLAAGIGSLMTRMTLMPAMFQRAGASMALFGTEASATVAALSAVQLALIGLAVGGFAFLMIQVARYKTAAQQMADSMQHTVDVARGMQIFGVIANNIGVLNSKLAQSSSLTQRASNENLAYVVGARQLASIQAEAAQQTGTYSAALTQQQQDMLHAAQAVMFISRQYGVNWVGALELGTQAGVRWDQGISKMNAAADINLIKVQQLIRGYQLMGQSAGAVGKDETVLGIEAALAATKIQQLTQAWDQFMQQITGGTNTLATFEQGLQNMASVATSTAGHLFAATGNMTQSTNAFAQSLTKFTGTSAQNWQNFDQVVTTGAENFINWMQEAGAMGVVSGQQMSGAIKGVVAQLIPFATHSQAARVALASLAAQTGQTVAPTNKALEAWVKGGMSAKQLAQFVNDATLKMGNMAQVAQNLGAVMQNDLVDMFDKAKIAASGLPNDLNALSNAIAGNNTPASVMHGDMMKVIGDLGTMHVSVPTITALLNTMGINISQAGVKALISSGQLSGLNSNLYRLNGTVRTTTGGVLNLAAAINALHDKSITITTYYKSVGLGNRFGHTGTGPLAAGTDNAAPGVHLVGEQGPELVLFGGGERVIPAPQTAAMLRPQTASAVTVHERQPIMVTLDGDAIYRTTRDSTLQYDIRNNTRGRYGGASGKMARN